MAGEFDWRAVRLRKVAGTGLSPDGGLADQNNGLGLAVSPEKDRNTILGGVLKEACPY